MKRAWIAAATLGLACSKSDGSGATPQPTPVVLGSIISLTGDTAGLGKDFADATTLAIEQINAQGGILGRPVRVAFEDDGTTEDGARVAFTNVLKQNVAAILGPTTSGQAFAMADLIKNSGVMLIGATTTSPQLTTMDDGDFFFRLSPSDVFQGQQVVDQLIRKATPAITNLCMVYRNDSYGTSMVQIVGDRVAPLGMTVVKSSYEPTATDLSGVMKPCNDAFRCGYDASADASAPACASADAQSTAVLFVTFVADGAALLDSAGKLGWSAQNEHFFFTDGGHDQGLVSLVANPAELEGCLGTAPSGPDPSKPEGEQLRQLQSSFRARFDRAPNLFIEEMYDAVYLAAAAIEKAGTDTDPKAVRDAVRLLQDPQGQHVQTGDWATIRSVIDAKTAINLDGASGALDFDANGDILPPYYYSIWTVQSGIVTDLSVVTLTAP